MNQIAAQQTAQRAGQTLMLIGVAMVMGGCVLGGLTAVTLHFLGQTFAAAIVAIVAGCDVLIGVGVQVAAYRKLQAAKGRA
jgi:NADH:ubiquinone oxidoreductase subunit K